MAAGRWQTAGSHKELSMSFTWICVSYLIFSFFNDKCLLAPKYSETLHLKCSAHFYSWSDSPIGCSAPLYSRSGSLIGSAYYFLYISFCLRFNKSLMNLTSLHQHHLQYMCNKTLVTCNLQFWAISWSVWQLEEQPSLVLASTAAFLSLAHTEDWLLDSP